MDKLMNLQPNQLTDLKIVLLMAAKNYLGISNLPSEVDLSQLCMFLKTNFKDFTQQEIDNALQMYASGSLAVDSKPYGVLSAVFLSDVLNEYRIHRRAWKAFEERKMNETKLLSQPEVNQEEKNKKLTDWIVEYILAGNSIPDTYAWDEVYQHLEKTKEIDLSVEDKKDFYILVREELVEQVTFYNDVTSKREDVRGMLSIINDTKSLQSLCRKRLVHLYLTSKLNKTNGTSNRTEEQEVHNDRLQQDPAADSIQGEAV